MIQFLKFLKSHPLWVTLFILYNTFIIYVKSYIIKFHLDADIGDRSRLKRAMQVILYCIAKPFHIFLHQIRK